MVGDPNYWSPFLKVELEQNLKKLQAPSRGATHDPWPQRSALLV